MQQPYHLGLLLSGRFGNPQQAQLPTQGSAQACELTANCRCWLLCWQCFVAILVFLEHSLIRGNDIACCPLSLLSDIITFVKRIKQHLGFFLQAGYEGRGLRCSWLGKVVTPYPTESALPLVWGENILHLHLHCAQVRKALWGLMFLQQCHTEA